MASPQSLRRAARYTVATVTIGVCMAVLWGCLHDLDKLRRSVRKRLGIEEYVQEQRALKPRLADTTARVHLLEAEIQSLSGKLKELGARADSISNEQAMASKERASLRSAVAPLETYAATEQFFGRLQMRSGGLCRFVALELSSYPNPATATYADCLRTVHARVADVPRELAEALPQVGSDVILALWAFRDRKPVPEAAIAVGQQFMGMPYAPERIGRTVQEMNRADTQTVEAPFFFIAQARVIPTAPPIRQTVQYPVRSRAELIAEGIARLQGELDANGGDWAKWMKRTLAVREALAKTSNAPEDVRRRNGHFADYNPAMLTLLDMVRPGFGGEQVTLVEQMRRFAGAFESRGIRFIYLPVPLKVQVYPEWFVDSSLVPDGGIVAPQWRKYIYDLLKAGVEVVDLLPVFLQHRRKEGHRPLYFQDHHWALAGMELAAQETAKHLSGALPAVAPPSLVRLAGTFSYQFPEMPGPQTLEGHSVWREGKNGLEPLEDDPSSPAIVFGDSHYYYALVDTPRTRSMGPLAGTIAGGNASFAAQLAFETQASFARGGAWFPLDIGSLSSIPPGTFHGKRVVIFVNVTVLLCGYNLASQNVAAAAFEPATAVEPKSAP